MIYFFTKLAKENNKIAVTISTTPIKEVPAATMVRFVLNLPNSAKRSERSEHVPEFNKICANNRKKSVYK